MELLKPGPDGSPLPAGSWVLRLSLPVLFNGTTRCSPKAFELSSGDRAEPVPRLSVFAEGLTTRRQCFELASNPQRSAVFRLGVDSIRSIRPNPDNPKMPNLDVEWERARTPDESGLLVPDNRPGALGHAGITNLGRSDILDSGQRKRLRASLADAAIFVGEMSSLAEK